MFDPNQMTPIGKTYAQIDAEAAEHVKAANEALASMRNKGGRWWRYSVSHCTFELVVGGPGAGEDNLVIALSACDFIAGPVVWQNQQLVVIFHCDRSNRPAWKFVLQDEAVGFRTSAGVFAWQRNFDLLKHGSMCFEREGE